MSKMSSKNSDKGSEFDSEELSDKEESIEKETKLFDNILKSIQ